MRVAALAAAAALLACGHGAIDLTIEAEGPGGAQLRVPEDIDRLDVHVERADNAEALLDRSYALDPVRQTFPLTLRMTQGDRTGDAVKIAAAGFLADAAVGSATALVPIQPQQVTSVTLRLEP
ncbi:MAG TPA: hypothetical protein VND93_02960 [Myxococcales bacterium]|nr:hypothetical protein [Myxococcales bacterium]